MEYNLYRISLLRCISSLDINSRSIYRDRNRPKVVDHRLENLTPNRREEMQQRRKSQSETTSERIPLKEDRFREYKDINDRKDNFYANQPLSRISFGKLPYPVGNAS